jgi:hypothetical protein
MIGLSDPVGTVTAGSKQASESVVGEVAESADNFAGGSDDTTDGFA